MLLLALAVLPCLLWLAFFYFQDWYSREPVKNIAITFGLGALATVPALLLNELVGPAVEGGVGAALGGWAGQLALFFLVVGPVEEAVKFAAVYLYAYRRPEFREPADGVIYSSAAALGFAAAENIFYLSQFGEASILVRGSLSNPGHAFFAAFWGLAMSRAKGASNLPRRRAKILTYGWLAAALTHGLFDALLAAAPVIGNLGVIILVLSLMALMFGYVEYTIIQMVRRSPLRAATQLLTTPVTCAACGAEGFPGRPCFHCGGDMPRAGAVKQGFARQCRNCGKECLPGARFCPFCGTTFDRPRTGERVAGLATAMSRQPHFVRVGPTGEEVLFVLNATQVRVGKTLDNEFVLDDDSVSKHHAQVVWHQSGHYYIADLKSTNGTYVNGERVTVQWLLDGFEVRLGDVNLIYRGPRFQMNQPPDYPRS